MRIYILVSLYVTNIKYIYLQREQVQEVVLVLVHRWAPSSAAQVPSACLLLFSGLFYVGPLLLICFTILAWPLVCELILKRIRRLIVIIFI